MATRAAGFQDVDQAHLLGRKNCNGGFGGDGDVRFWIPVPFERPANGLWEKKIG